MKKEFILDLLSQIKNIENDPENAAALPRNSYYLDYDKVLCCHRETGEGRYPYSHDGLMVWLRTTGFIDACESTFTIFKTANYGEESAVAFFGGVNNGDGTYTPVSITGAGRQAVEKDVSRYIVYSLKCAYCIADTKDTVFALRLHVDSDKHIHFDLTAINKSGETKEFYVASFMEAMLRHMENENFWARMSKYGLRREDGSFILTSKNKQPDMLVIKKKITEGVPTAEYATTGRSVFIGSRGLAVANSLSLVKGKFAKDVYSVNTTDLPVASDIIHFEAKGGDSVSLKYEALVCNDMETADSFIAQGIDGEKIDSSLEILEKEEKDAFDTLKIRFDGWKSGKVKSDTFNKFLRSVQKQTSVCAHGKNYAGQYLGIRDVFQQLEGALIWQPELSREKILVAMNNILTTGRPPRMFSVQKDAKGPIPVCLEKYIDQGVWIISTIYTYLAYTGDFSILDEECYYIDAPDEPWCNAHRTEEKDSVLCHLIRIADFLISNVDTEYTKCIRVLFGDWNDAVDGLGDTKDEGKEFGTGVTVMATLQFRQNLIEMTEILSLVGGHDDLIEKYEKVRVGIEEGLEKFAIDTNEKGERRIVHGWGDKVSYKVGSFSDPDGIARYSLTPNSFWAITGFIKRDPSLKESIMACMDAVSSKYGLKTFDKAFPLGLEGVGRIANIVPGTYENSCAYVHGSLFGTMAMFELGESERAFEEIEKSIVITHDNCTMTSFIMPNSYCENEEYCMDGESMGDWHTGSGAVLIKETIRYAFGVYPTLGGLRIQLPAFFPAEKGEINLKVKGVDLTVRYENKGLEKRNITVNGTDNYTESFDDLMNIPVIFIKNEDIKNAITVEIKD